MNLCDNGTLRLEYIPRLKLDCGTTLHNVPVAYQTWGQLAVAANNVILVCHPAFSPVNIAEWWPSLLADDGLDITRMFVLCINCLGSPYGTASPLTLRDDQRTWASDFPPTTIRDDVHLQKALLRRLGVQSINAVLGVSMGGAIALEWLLCAPNFVQKAIVIAASARTGGWQLGWNEAQRQNILIDEKYEQGDYSIMEQPARGLKAARMTAFLSYQDPTSPWLRRKRSQVLLSNMQDKGALKANFEYSSDDEHSKIRGRLENEAERFAHLFDANCYLALLRKMDSHCISYGRYPTLSATLASITKPVLVIGFSTDILTLPSEQEELAAALPNGQFVKIESAFGHQAYSDEAVGQEMSSIVANFIREADLEAVDILISV